MEYSKVKLMPIFAVLVKR